MLTKLIIKNFQKHKHKVIKLDKCLTIIVGPNDAGKSAILRSLRWVCLNRPSGKSVMRRGSTSASVTVCFGKHKLKRYTGRENGYVLDSTQFNAIRSNVPEQIANLLKVDEINFQRQHESHFWFSKSPGETAKELNALVDLTSIDAVQAAITGKLRAAKSEYDIVHKNIESVRADLAGLRWVARFWPAINRLAGQLNQYRLKSHRLARIRSLSADGSRQLTRQRKALAGLPIAHAGHQTARELAWQSDRLADLRSLVDRLARASGAWRGSLPELSRLADLRRRFHRLESILLDADSLVLEEATATGDLIQIRKEFTKQLGDRCPTCGSSLK